MAKSPSKLPSSLQPQALPEATPILSEFEPAAPIEPAVVAPVGSAEPAPQTAEIIQAKTRYGFPVYVPTQKKLLAPNEAYPLILDSWVKNQLEQERGALVRVKL